MLLKRLIRCVLVLLLLSPISTNVAGARDENASKSLRPAMLAGERESLGKNRRDDARDVRSEDNERDDDDDDSDDHDESDARDRRNAPFEYTEERERCEDYEKFKQPFFGNLHQHTGLSFDAATRFVRSRPADSYAFAKGAGEIITPDQFGFQTRSTSLMPPALGARPLDFLGITDHAETFGEMGICLDNDEFSTAPGRQSLECALLTGPKTANSGDKPGPSFLTGPRTAPIPGFARAGSSAAFSLLATSTFLSANNGMQLPVCYANPEACADAELRVWNEVQAAANDAYDRTSACEFTTFIAYENTSMPSGVTHHRNVIFRNDDVIDQPITAIDISRRSNPNPELQVTAPSLVGNPDPTILWSGLEDECNNGVGRCEALVIPHNTNLSSPAGLTRTVMHVPGATDSERRSNARLMARMQPLLEIFQIKGASECRYDPRFASRYSDEPWRAQTGLNQLDSPDEYCDFELLDSKGGGAAAGLVSGAGEATAPEAWGDRTFVRNLFKIGLTLKDEYGVNPFEMGVGASQDDHNGRPGFVAENKRFDGHTGVGDAFPTRDAGTIQNSPGGLWAVWAEENGRDSIFTGLKNKETYGTSGTRPKVRFFGGWKYPNRSCEKNFVRIGYRKGVPMGSTLPRRKQAEAPRFIAAAWKDDGPDGTDLQRIQIIKGWVDERGDTRESVYDVAVTDGVGADAKDEVPLSGSGSESLCTVWEDPDFDASQKAFYYARVLENPVIRYSTDICQEQGIDPTAPKEVCEGQLEAYSTATDIIEPNTYPGLEAVVEAQRAFNAGNYSQCCAQAGDEPNQTPFVQPVIQERAWTSPIWYYPSLSDS